jgi:uncharacterized protein YkwD
VRQGALLGARLSGARLPGAALLGAALLSAGCTVPIGGSPPTGSAPVPESPTTAAMSGVARAVAAEVNRTRLAHGLAALSGDAALDRAAREHSEELAARRTLDHNSTDPERRTMTMRIEAAGGTWMRAAENLASISGPSSRVPPQAVQMWLNSDGHRRNMLSASYTHTGVGVAIDRFGAWYVTQLYVFPRPAR